MTAIRHDITVDQGASFLLNVQALNEDRSVMDLTGYSARMQVRSSPSSNTVLMEATTAAGTITINAPGGTVMVNVGADLTAAMTWNSGWYDLEIYTSSTNVRRLLEGYASLSLEVTR